MADDRDRQNQEDSDEIGRAPNEDPAAATEDDEFEETDDDTDEDEGVEEGK